MNLPFHRILFLPSTVIGLGTLLLLSCGQESTSAQDSADQRLVPAAMGIRTDRKGTSWNVESNGTIGRIGSTMVNSGLALSIEGEDFSGFQPMMTADGKEFVIPGRPFVNVPGLQVQRRIRLLEDDGILRYAEMLYNGSTDPVSITLSLDTNFSGNYQTFLTNRGRTDPVLLEDSETSLVVLPGAAQSTRAFLFVLADEESEIKPSISAQNRYGLGFQYPVTLAPGETKIILHQVAQVIIPQNFDRTTLLKLFRPYSFAETATNLPEAWTGRLANVGTNAHIDTNQPSESFGIRSLGVPAGPRDILVIGDKTKLLGEASGGVVSIKNSYGETTVPFDDLAAIRGRGGEDSAWSKIFLSDGQIFSAEVGIPDLMFTQTGGDQLALDLSTLDRLIMAEQKGKNPNEGTSFGMVETYRGDRIKVIASDSMKIEGLTPWGKLPVSLNDLVWLGPSPTIQNGHWIEVSDGTRCLIFLNDDSIPLDSLLLGDINLEARQLRSIFTPQSDKKGRWDNEVGIRTVIQVSGSQRLIGDISNSTLPVVSDGIRIETATSKIRRIERLRGMALSRDGLPEMAPSFEIERWDGGILTGLIDLDLLSLRVHGQDWKIPLNDIVKIETPSPELNSEALEKMAALLNLLGAEEWSVREKATRELGAFGYLANPVLRQHLRTTDDPEVSRRIERILSGLN
ncbi:MAG: HEAT repeat domain-containing protein [Verrucomicrobiales bacterium]|nr:HEAT repeat domain-containing protein [Verrucomicrobiales bacterium]